MKDYRSEARKMLVSGDLEGANYSSMRAGLVEFRRRLESWQWGIIIPQLCDPLWRRFVQVAVLAGLIPADAFAADPAAFLSSLHGSYEGSAEPIG